MADLSTGFIAASAIAATCAPLAIAAAIADWLTARHQAQTEH